MEQRRSLGECAVVCVDMWASAISWPPLNAGPWTLDVIAEHNALADRLFRDATKGSAAESGATTYLGDGRLYLFEKADAAKAIEFVGALLDAFPATERIETSIGIAMGTVERVHHADDATVELLGRPVSLATRLADVADRGQALADRSVMYVLEGWSSTSAVAWDKDLTSLRLPASGDSRHWPITSVVRMSRNLEASPRICNRAAAMDQVIRLRSLTLQAQESWNGRLNEHERAWRLIDELATLNRYEPRAVGEDELRAIGAAIEHHVYKDSGLVQLLAHLPPDGTVTLVGAAPVAEADLLDEVARAPALLPFLRTLGDAYTALGKFGSNVMLDRLRPNLHSDLAVGSPQARAALAHEIRITRSTIKGDLRATYEACEFVLVEGSALDKSAVSYDELRQLAGHRV